MDTHRESDHALTVAQPALPLLFLDRHAVDADDFGGVQGVCLRQYDFDGHCLFIHEVADVDLLAPHAWPNSHILVVGIVLDTLL